MVRTGRPAPCPTAARRPPAVKAGGMRVSKKQENGLVKKNTKPPGKDKTSAVVSISKIQKMSVVLAEALDKTEASCRMEGRECDSLQEEGKAAGRAAQCSALVLGQVSSY
ncbi:death-associated protein-like 1 isoform X2 [Aythya fuligula]|uniref:Death-associated protein-like 1 isoform X2 n=1 Tax=Aythya fuligula TaxID=219594 RepID=A0A6J3D556_AYTFU|nr:death-associated protein-like 1 isoform X2 [Aythya fuligula]